MIEAAAQLRVTQLKMVGTLRRFPGDQEKLEKGECIYVLEGQEFRHAGTMRQNRRQMIANLRYAFRDVQFVHRCHMISISPCICHP